MCKFLNALASIYIVPAGIALALTLFLGGCNLADDEAVVAATVASAKNGATVTATQRDKVIAITCSATSALNAEWRQAQDLGLVSSTSRTAKAANAGLGFIASVCGDGGQSGGITLAGIVDLWQTFQAARSAVAQAKAATTH